VTLHQTLAQQQYLLLPLLLLLLLPVMMCWTYRTAKRWLHLL
jgi:hypothetical protein